MRRDGGRILVGLDADETAADVLAVARRLATATGAALQAVHVGAHVPPRLAALATAAGVTVEVEAGDPVTVLRRRLDDPAVVAAVVGCRREAGGPRPAGHVSLGLVQLATAPVVAVPPATLVGEKPLRDVLLPLDGSASTEAAVGPTIAALAGSGLRITVAHVFDAAGTPRFLDQPHHGLEAWGHEFLARHARPDLDLVLRAGHPGEQLLDVITATAPDLVVLGWSRDLASGRAQTVRELLSSSTVPLLLVPIDGAEGPAQHPLLVADGGSDW